MWANNSCPAAATVVGHARSGLAGVLLSYVNVEPTLAFEIQVRAFRVEAGQKPVGVLMRVGFFLCGRTLIAGLLAIEHPMAPTQVNTKPVQGEHFWFGRTSAGCHRATLCARLTFEIPRVLDWLVVFVQMEVILEVLGFALISCSALPMRQEAAIQIPVAEREFWHQPESPTVANFVVAQGSMVPEMTVEAAHPGYKKVVLKH